ncbi:MAG: Fic family protein [bacterium]
MLTLQENIFLAKKVLVNSIYSAAKIEGCNVTFPQTQTIIDGAVINGVSVDDIQTVLNLRDGWKYVLNNITESFNLDFVCKINEYIARNESLNWGTLRTGRVDVGEYIPPIPIEKTVINDIDKILRIENPVDRAVHYFAYGCKQQLFWDENKRTSLLAANKILIENGCGILIIEKENMQEFNTSLYNWYTKEDFQSLESCLKKCVKTII